MAFCWEVAAEFGLLKHSPGTGRGGSCKAFGNTSHRRRSAGARRRRRTAAPATPHCTRAHRALQKTRGRKCSASLPVLGCCILEKKVEFGKLPIAPVLFPQSVSQVLLALQVLCPWASWGTGVELKAGLGLLSCCYLLPKASKQPFYSQDISLDSHARGGRNQESCPAPPSKYSYESPEVLEFFQVPLEPNASHCHKVLPGILCNYFLS